MKQTLLLALVCALCVSALAVSIEKRGDASMEADSFTVTGTETYADAEAEQEAPELLGRGDMDSSVAASKSASVSASARRGSRVVTKRNSEFTAAHDQAGKALAAAADAHRALAAHHSAIRAAKKTLRDLQKKTAGLTAKAQELTNAASTATTKSNVLVNTDLTPASDNDDGKVKVGAGCTPSGAAWVQQFPTSSSTNDLVEPFRSNANKFIAALKAAGASVSIAATYRPAERAYLMHYSYKVAKRQIAAASVPPMAGVNICWNHANAVSGAQAMVNGYGIAYAPALVSRHTARNAIDMNISWGKAITINGVTCNAGNGASSSCMHKVGAKFGLIKLVDDPPHWSDNGH